MKKQEHIQDHVRFSVIIPTYNSRETLSACLQSLSRQTLPKDAYEVIVVDDGSTDDTARIVAGFDVISLVQPHQGQASARNRGIQIAKGEILVFTDADCVPQADWIQKIVEPFQESDVIGVRGAYKTIQKGLAAGFAQAEIEDRYDWLKKSSVIDMIGTHAAAFRKEALLHVGGFDEHFLIAEDTELSCRLATAGYKLVFQPDAFVYHTHRDSFWQYVKLKFWRGYWRTIVYTRYPGTVVKDSYTPPVIKAQTLLMVVSLLLAPFSWSVPSLLYGILLLWGVILASSCPFAVKTFQKNRKVGLIAPIIVFLRSMAFGLGSLFGLARSIFYRNPCVNHRRQRRR